MKTIKKQYRAAHVENIPWKQSLYRFLRNYRAIPAYFHWSTTCHTTLCPLRTRLPELEPEPSDDESVRNQDKIAKDRMKADADKRVNIRKKEISIGDAVIVKRHGHVNKDQTPYDTEIYTVIAKKGSMITASSGLRNITRNSSFFKLVRAAAADPDTEPLGLNPPVPNQAPPIPDQDTAPEEPRHNPPRNRRPPSRFKDFV